MLLPYYTNKVVTISTKQHLLNHLLNFLFSITNELSSQELGRCPVLHPVTLFWYGVHESEIPRDDLDIW